MASPSSSTAPYLSVVAASRNDDHGGDPLVRTQIFINTFARQCEKYHLPAELILVDWNPVPGRPGLAGVLQLPAEATFCLARVITVPAVLHDRLKYADRLPFFQMIAKNAGIRRARGKFILATNIDIIFSDELMRYIAKQQLDPAKMLRVDRYDIHCDIPPAFTVDQTLEYAWTHPVRSNRRIGLTDLTKHLYGDDWFKRTTVPDPAVCAGMEGFTLAREEEGWSVRPQRAATVDDLHTNACGDFTLLAREGWAAITGYAEFTAYSFNIDSLGVVAAHYAGFEEVALLPPCVCFHIEHSLGSGWTPEGEKKLFERLNKAGILNPEWHVLTPLVDGMRSGEKPTALNGPAWGMADIVLPEDPLLPGRIAPTPVQPRDGVVPPGGPVGALRPEFDLDRLSLWQERWHNPMEHLNQMLNDTRSALKRTEEYLKAVSKDSEDRLASIHYYQGKLKQAYADHDHNVAYIETRHAEIAAHVRISAAKDAIINRLNADIERNVTYVKTLEAEIAAHVKVAADHNAIIAGLNDQLRRALEQRPAGK